MAHIHAFADRPSIPPATPPKADPLARWQALGAAGIVVSVCYGPGKDGARYWSVDIYGPVGDRFLPPRPFAAASFSHCLDIAEAVARDKGWTA